MVGYWLLTTLQQLVKIRKRLLTNVLSAVKFSLVSSSKGLLLLDGGQTKIRFIYNCKGVFNYIIANVLSPVRRLIDFMRFLNKNGERTKIVRSAYSSIGGSRSRAFL